MLLPVQILFGVNIENAWPHENISFLFESSPLFPIKFNFARSWETLNYDRPEKRQKFRPFYRSTKIEKRIIF